MLPGLQVNDLTVVQNGLTTGERVVVDGQSRLDQGTRVAITGIGTDTGTATLGRQVDSSARSPESVGGEVAAPRPGNVNPPAPNAGRAPSRPPAPTSTGRPPPMNVSERFIRRPVMTILLMVGIVVFGVFTYGSLPISDLPTVDYPTISVSASLPGASPQTMAAAVATPLEKQFSTIAGIDNMTSTSSLGSTSITLQFSLDRDIDAAAQDVQAAIAKTLRQLPLGISRRRIRRRIRRRRRFCSSRSRRRRSRLRSSTRSARR